MTQNQLMHALIAALANVLPLAAQEAGGLADLARDGVAAQHEADAAATLINDARIALADAAEFVGPDISAPTTTLQLSLEPMTDAPYRVAGEHVTLDARDRNVFKGAR